MLSTYETCLLEGNSQEACDCVADGGDMLLCAIEDCLGEYQGDSEDTSGSVSIDALNLSQQTISQIYNYLITENGCSEEALGFALAVAEALADGDCAFLPNVNINQITAPYNPNLLGDSDDVIIQQNHEQIKQQFQQILSNDGNLAAVNYLISIYNMEIFGPDEITANYNISFSDNVQEGDGVTIGEFNPNTGNLIGCEIILENDIMEINDFGYITRVIKHELYHVFQNQVYGLNGISDATMEFDAYFSSIYRFNNLPRLSDPERIIQLVVWLEENWDNMPNSEKSIRQDQYDIVSNMFPKICNDD